MKETRFKQTEIGLIPEDWGVTKIGNITDIYSGGTPDTNNASYWGGNIPWMSSGELNKKFIYDVIGRITESGLNNSSTHWIPKECILIGLAGQGKTRGTAAMNFIPLCTNQSIAAIYPSDKFVSTYIYYYIDSIYDNLRKISDGGGGRGGLTKTLIGNLHIPLPNTKEQNKIASALTSIDNLLLSLDKLIEKKRLIKQGAMQELLTGKKRLPGFTGEWVERRLGEIGEIIKVSINPQLYRNQSFSEYSMPAYDLNKQPEIKYGEEMFSNRTKIDGTVLLYNKLNVRQRRIWYIENCKHSSICSMEFLPYKVYRDYLKFFYYKLSIDSVTNYFVGISKGTSNSQKRISPNDFLDFKVKYPRELQEQKAIATVLSSMDKEIESLEGKKAKYEQIKQGMMQQLLTGMIRLIS